MSVHTARQQVTYVHPPKLARGREASVIRWFKLRAILSPAATATFAVVSFFACGAAVVATATLVALQVH